MLKRLFLALILLTASSATLFAAHPIEAFQAAVKDGRDMDHENKQQRQG
jgi:hypothetical protein